MAIRFSLVLLRISITEWEKIYILSCLTTLYYSMLSNAIKIADFHSPFRTIRFGSLPFPFPYQLPLHSSSTFDKIMGLDTVSPSARDLPTLWTLLTPSARVKIACYQTRLSFISIESRLSEPPAIFFRSFHPLVSAPWTIYTFFISFNSVLNKSYRLPFVPDLKFSTENESLACGQLLASNLLGYLNNAPWQRNL